MYVEFVNKLKFRHRTVICDTHNINTLIRNFITKMLSSKIEIWFWIGVLHNSFLGLYRWFCMLNMNLIWSVCLLNIFCWLMCSISIVYVCYVWVFNFVFWISRYEVYGSDFGFLLHFCIIYVSVVENQYYVFYVWVLIFSSRPFVGLLYSATPDSHFSWFVRIWIYRNLEGVKRGRGGPRWRVKISVGAKFVWCLKVKKLCMSKIHTHNN